jgi:hypothetical protein
MFPSRRASLALALALALPGFACHESSSGGAVLPSTDTTNLGLASGKVLGSGPDRLLLVPEADQGRDLDGDGDLDDTVVHVLHLRTRQMVETGLVLGFLPSFSSLGPPLRPVVSAGETVAFAVSESETGGLDRNADGDADDLVLALYEPDTRTVANLGVSTSFVIATRDFLAFLVPEVSEGEDLDGDGGVDESDHVLFVRDLESGDTWKTGLAPARALGAAGDFVALLVAEAGTDGNGDGDTSDFLFELYDVRTRSVQHTGLAYRVSLAGPTPPAARHGKWVVQVYEGDQGADLDGDGDALDVLALVYDPETRNTRVLGSLGLSVLPELDPVVLFEGAPGDYPFVWLYDARRDLLVSTGFAGTIVRSLVDRLVITVDEQTQGQDLDRNGFLDGLVPVLYDLESGSSEVLPIDAVDVISTERSLLLRARESASRRDWNGDGDQDDRVLFSWNPLDGRLVNTRLSPFEVVSLGDALALLELDESALSRDLNDDGDEDDFVLHVYGTFDRRLTNLSLATLSVLGTGLSSALCGVNEARQGADLNGDGDQDDVVLHLTEVLFYAFQAGG